MPVSARSSEKREYGKVMQAIWNSVGLPRGLTCFAAAGCAGATRAKVAFDAAKYPPSKAAVVFSQILRSSAGDPFVPQTGKASSPLTHANQRRRFKQTMFGLARQPPPRVARRSS